MRRHIERYVLPHWEKTAIHAIRRSDVNDLLRHIEREHGAQQADHVLSTLVVAVPLVCEGGRRVHAAGRGGHAARPAPGAGAEARAHPQR